MVLFPILLGNIHQRELGCLRGRSSPAAGAPNRSCHCAAARTVRAGGSDAHHRDRDFYVCRALTLSSDNHLFFLIGGLKVYVP